jgi:hypothetical protein
MIGVTLAPAAAWGFRRLLPTISHVMLMSGVSFISLVSATNPYLDESLLPQRISPVLDEGCKGCLVKN